MNSSAYLTIASFVYTVLLIVVYFYKKRVSIIENKIYIGTVIITLISIILFLITSMFTSFLSYHQDLNKFILKTYIVSLGLWITSFTIYTYATVLKNDINKKTKVKKYTLRFIIVILVISYLVYALPIEYIMNKENSYYIGGACVNIIYIYSLILIIIDIYYLIRNYKKISFKKFLPLITFIALGILTIYITIKVPSLLLITPLEAFITFLIYFTIENPDIEIIDEFNEASENMTKMISEKDLFLFNSYQKMKYPLNEIKRISNIAINTVENSPEEAKELIREIQIISNDLYIEISKIFDMNNVDSSKLKVYNSEYNLKLLLEIIISKLKDKLDGTNIKLIENISPMMPYHLYGDSGALKEVINIIIDNSISHTKEGYIEMLVNCIIKDDICRLIIIIEDSGEGIPLTKLDTIYKGNVNEDNLTKVKKMLELMGGTVLLNTKQNKGTKVTIVLDQKIVPEKNSTLKENTKLYFGNIKVLLVDDNKEFTKKVEKELSDYNIKLDIVSLGITCLNKIRNEETYDIIFISEELPQLNGIIVFKKLKNIPTFNIPTYLISNKYLDKQELLDIGFSDVIHTEEEIKEIIKNKIEKNNN